MPPEIRKYLQDALDACGLLGSFVQGKGLQDYVADPLLKAGVEREFTIIGEALLQGHKSDQSLDMHISQLRRIIGFRNILVHGYAQIDDQKVWGVIQKDVPVLKIELQRLLSSLSPP